MDVYMLSSHPHAYLTRLISLTRHTTDLTWRHSIACSHYISLRYALRVTWFLRHENHKETTAKTTISRLFDRGKITFDLPESISSSILLNAQVIHHFQALIRLISLATHAVEWRLDSRVKRKKWSSEEREGRNLLIYQPCDIRLTWSISVKFCCGIKRLMSASNGPLIC